MRFFVALMILVTVTAARADDADTTAARKHFTDGSRAFALGDFQHAIEEYKAGYKIRANPEFLFNIAQAYRLAGDPAQAIFFYKSYLSNAPDSDNRDEVEMRIHACEAQLAQQKAHEAAQQQAPPPTTTPTTTPTMTPTTTVAPPPPVEPQREPRHISHKTVVALAVIGGVVVVGGAVALGLTLGLPRSLHTTLPTIGPNASRLSLAVSF